MICTDVALEVGGVREDLMGILPLDLEMLLCASRAEGECGRAAQNNRYMLEF